MKLRDHKKISIVDLCIIVAFSALQLSTAWAEISKPQLDPFELLNNTLAAPVNSPIKPIAPISEKNFNNSQDRSQPSDINTVDIAAMDINIPSQDNSQNIVTEHEQKLWKAKVGLKAENDNNDKSKDELALIIQLIRSVEFSKKDEQSAPAITLDPSSDPNTSPINEEAAEEFKIEFGKPALAYEPVSDNTLKMIQQLSQQPENTKSLLKLAEVLYRSNCLKEANDCYQLVLNRDNKDNAFAEANEDWILFQIGNCLRKHDPAKAVDAYSQLIAKYPNSHWLDMAKARQSLSSWYMQDKPDELVQKKKSQETFAKFTTE